MKRKIEDFFVNEGTSIQEAMRCIDKNGKGIALVVDGEKRLIATITDGDIRRAILDGLNLNKLLSELIKKKSDSVYPEPTTALESSDKSELLRIMRKQNIRHIPLLDSNHRVTDLITFADLAPQDTLPLQAVLMAGGFGKRLQPLTEDMPKPMLPVGDRPLMEHTIEQLKHTGIRNVSITTHYQAEKITKHFGNGEAFGVNIEYVPEVDPLGTAGALSLLQDLDEPLLVINGDILTKVDFRAMHKFHCDHSADLTVGVRLYDFKIPYGVVESSGSQVLDIKEKPEIQFLVSAGIYILEPSVLKFIPKNEYFDMPHLIRRVIDEGGQVVNFPVVEYWLDIGHHSDYEKAKNDANDGGLKK